MALDIIPIALTVVTSIAQIAAFCVAGYFAAVKGIIDLKCRKQLNRLNISIFTPALIFGKVSFFLTREKLASLWGLQILMIFYQQTQSVPDIFLCASNTIGLRNYYFSFFWRVLLPGKGFSTSKALPQPRNSWFHIYEHKYYSYRSDPKLISVAG